MSYAGQMRVAADEIRMRLNCLDSDCVRFAWLGAKSFESATAMLFTANSKQPCSQFIAHGCLLESSLKMIDAFENAEEVWGAWPQKLTQFAQYHRSGYSSLDLAIKFASDMSTEFAVAKMRAFPNQAVESKELDELAEWQTQFRLELNEKRSELATIPLWTLHQERDKLLDGINNELAVALEKRDEAKRKEQTIAPESKASSKNAEKKSIDAIVSDMPKRFRLAYLAAKYAEENQNKELSDRDAYDWLAENGADDYSLPVFDTFTRYLTNARNLTDEQRKTSTQGRKGRSLVMQSEL